MPAGYEAPPSAAWRRRCSPRRWRWRDVEGSCWWMGPANRGGNAVWALPVSKSSLTTRFVPQEKSSESETKTWNFVCLGWSSMYWYWYFCVLGVAEGRRVGFESILWGRLVIPPDHLPIDFVEEADTSIPRNVFESTTTIQILYYKLCDISIAPHVFHSLLAPQHVELY